MSAPSIPNLLSLRGSRGGIRSRGRGRGGGPPASNAPSSDATIQGTDGDAAVSRLSVVDLGYIDDPYARYFVQSSPVPPTRRLPIINRGTYTRTTAMDKLISSFLSTGDGQRRQIISLGAGTDTRCFRLFSQPDAAALIYHEVDFPATSAKKLHIVQANPTLRNLIPNLVPEDNTWSSRQLQNGCEYWCHGLDLRDLLKPDGASLTGLQPDVPTLLISECCLCYLEVEDTKSVIKHFTDKIQNISIAIYEPIKPDDPFGRQMVSNLAARSIRMPTLEVYKQATDQVLRLNEAGFLTVRNMTVEEIWRKWISTEEKERVDELEGLDEVEEWNLLAGHYIVVWGWRGSGFDGIQAMAT